MNIKKLETTLQTILEDDSFEINEKNINEKIGKELEKASNDGDIELPPEMPAVM